MKITKNSQLIEWLSGIQVICLAIALVGGGFWVRAEIQQVVRKQIMGDNELIAMQMSKLIRQYEIEKVEYGNESWERLQSLVEDVSLPNEGYMCVADSITGKLLCHPDIRTTPMMREADVSTMPISFATGVSNVRQQLETNSKLEDVPATGLMGSGNGTQVVSVASLPDQGGVLFVHQSEKGFRNAVNMLLLPIGGISLVLGLALILVTKRASVGVLQIYENSLAKINEGLEEIVCNRTRSLMKTRDAVIFGLAKLSESRDNDTGEHLDRIRVYVSILAKNLASIVPVDERLISEIGLASSLHDIGKVGIPDQVLLKPGRLTPEERAVIEIHPTIGKECLEAIECQLGDDNFLRLATEICAHHHEKWDGTGYPQGLEGTQIPLAARIVALADVYDALRSRRPYKEPMSHDRAKQIILEGNGNHFDPDVVSAFLIGEQDFREFSEMMAQPKGNRVAPGSAKQATNIPVQLPQSVC